MPKFKKKVAPAREGVPTQPVTSDAEPLLANACRSFVASLVSVSTGQHSILHVRAVFDTVAKDIAVLDGDDRDELLKEVDTFIGRVRSHVEPLLSEWGAANKAALISKTSQ